MLQNGTLVNNRYIVIKEIGKGGTSLVYLVKDIHIGRLLALKIIPKDDSMAFCFAKREVSLLRSIDFVMFPHITDAFAGDTFLYLVSDYVEGISLDRIIKTRNISRDKALKWSLDILSALKYLHGLSPPILYLDLKPENVLVLPNGNIKMVDFGIARRITTHYTPMGTPGYAAPEQYDYKGDSLSEKTDIFSFGMTYFAIRTGLIPNEDMEYTREIIRKNTILSLREKSFILKCIEDNPEKRFDCIQSVTHHINQISISKINPGKIINYVGMTVIIFVLIGVFMIGIHRNEQKESAARQMISRASEYMKDGEYTPEGLKVITAFINSGCLDEDTKNNFTYEVAMNYFQIQKDYNLAGIYFGKLNTDEYPQASVLLELCRAQTGFEYDEQRIMFCIGRLYDIASRQANNVRRHEMYLIISQYYINYESDKTQGIKKAVTVLEEGKKQLESGGVDMENDVIISMRKEYDERLGVMYERAENIARSGKIDM